MKHLIAFLAALVSLSALAADKPGLTQADAEKLVSTGACISMPLGTGLVDGKGWLHQPYPGPVTISAPEGATVEMIGRAPAQNMTVNEWAAGKPYYVIVKPASAAEHLVWKIPGFVEAPVPLGFQISPKGF